MIHAAEPIAPAVDMTPIIDMVFLLLIFFLVATTFQQTEREMKVALPEAAAATPISVALREIVVNVTADGGMIVSGRPITPDALRAMIEQAVRNNPGQKVAVRADRAATWASVVRPLDIAKGAGVQQPYLDTVPPR